ncbi:hypothetical protein EZV62_010620 [Acer yangbiense]|uniref:Uncharacterized protein n=1 Tax=Acer yangbiense TaxID=1000413 RepID=A0A5C7I4X8_9ROSI|nr:hypothetical protein EZV62_010620 [Acer yangbiense]
MNRDGDEITDDSPMEQVRLTVPITDDPTLPTLTFRTWVLGPITCVILAFASQFSSYRQNLFTIPNVSVQILIVILGKSMAATLPSKLVKVPGTSWSFSMNPGPFNIKEHVLLSILATTGSNGAFNIATLAVRKLYYHKYISFWPGLLMIMTTEGIARSGSALSVICLLWKNSVIAQLIGSGRNGFGIASFSFDWNVISSFLSNPLAFPFSTIVNTAIGFILMVYIICPIAYWSNWNNARHFPFLSFTFFDNSGQEYNVSKVLNENDLTFNEKSYKGYSKLYLSVVLIYVYGFNFALTTASLTHFITFHGRDVWQQFKRAYGNSNNSTFEDVHNRLMKKYNPIPQWWFYAIMVSTIGLLIYSCEGFGKQFQLPYWGILLSCLFVMTFILPLGVLSATTGQDISLNVAAELLIGYIYPGKPIAYMVFTDLCRSTNYHALMDNICEPEKLPKGSPWTCPQMTAFYDFSIIWGVIGPKRMFFPDGMYLKLCYFFLIGAIAPLLIWVLSKLFPEKGWIKSINIPIIMAGASSLLAFGTVGYWSWIFVGIVFNLIVYRKYKDWWGRYNYLLAYGLDLGVAFQVLLTSMTLQMSGVYGVNWWGLDVGDHCPLSQCPTAPGVSVEGCPVL